MGRSFLFITIINNNDTITRHTTKMYWEADKQLWSFLVFGSGWRRGVTVMFLSLYPQDKKLPIPDILNPGWAPDPVWKVVQNNISAPNKHHNPDCADV